MSYVHAVLSVFNFGIPVALDIMYCDALPNFWPWSRISDIPVVPDVILLRTKPLCFVSEAIMTDILLSESEKTFILHGVEQNFRQAADSVRHVGQYGQHLKLHSRG